MKLTGRRVKNILTISNIVWRTSEAVYSISCLRRISTFKMWDNYSNSKKVFFFFKLVLIDHLFWITSLFTSSVAFQVRSDISNIPDKIHLWNTPDNPPPTPPPNKTNKYLLVLFSRLGGAALIWLKKKGLKAFFHWCDEMDSLIATLNHKREVRSACREGERDSCKDYQESGLPTRGVKRTPFYSDVDSKISSSSRLFLTIRLYWSLLLVSPLDGIQCPHRAALYKSLFCWLVNTGVFKNVAYEFVLTSLAVVSMSCSS